MFLSRCEITSFSAPTSFQSPFNSTVRPSAFNEQLQQAELQLHSNLIPKAEYLRKKNPIKNSTNTIRY